MHVSTLALVAAAAVPVLSQSAAWGQCGGIGYSGPTTCISGYSCEKQNDYYFQCLPGGGAVPPPPATTLITAVKPPASPAPDSGGSTPWWFGINLSGAEFGEKIIPGAYGKEYIWYDRGAIDQLLSKGMNMFRVNFLMERLTPNSLTGPFDPFYLGNLTAVSTTTTAASPAPSARECKWYHMAGILITVLGYQLHHEQGRLRHGTTTQLRPLLRPNHDRPCRLPDVVEERRSTVQGQPARRLRH